MATLQQQIFPPAADVVIDPLSPNPRRPQPELDIPAGNPLQPEITPEDAPAAPRPGRPRGRISAE